MAHLVRRAAAVLLAAFILFSATTTSAQLVGGSIHGSVKDSQGAMLPGAAVVVRHVGTGASHEATSDQSGHYQVVALPPGEYEVAVSITGFRSVAHRGIRLTVGQTPICKRPTSCSSTRACSARSATTSTSPPATSDRAAIT